MNSRLSLTRILRLRITCSTCLSLLLFFLFLSLPAYAAWIHADPLISYESDEGSLTVHAFGEILESSGQCTAVRPLFYNDKKTHETDILYPIGRFTKGRGMVFPIYRGMENEDHSHTEFFPVFYGNYQGSSYGGIFPLYGTMYHRFGYSRARFALLPLYADTTIDDKTTYTVLWPVFSCSKDNLFRVFPLYGWKKTGDKTSRYVLWPFIQQSRGPGEDRMDAVLPLFSYDRGQAHQSISILWPFFTYNRDDASGHRSVDFPWPLLRRASGAYEETKIFPFYWVNTDSKTYAKTHILWPLWSKRSWHYEDTGTDEEIVTVLLTNWLTTKTMQDRQLSRTLYLWPFLYTSWNDTGNEWNFPCIFPLFFDDGFSRSWGPVLSLAHGSSDLSSSETSILWRTILMDRHGATQRFSLAFLVSVTKTPEYYQWGFMGDLLRLRYEADR